MTSNYLTEKYPDEGYNKPLYPSFDRKPWEKRTEEQTAIMKKYESLKMISCINVCECGEEWESNLGKYQEGCYPYVEGVCHECKIKNDEKEQKLKKEKAINDRIAQFDSSIPPRYRGKLKSPINKELLGSTCSIVWGGFGTGKTWECYTVAKELMTKGEIKSYKLLTEIDLLNDLKDGFDEMNYKIDRYKSMDLLILDEAGKNNDSDFNKAQLFGILNHRYDWEKKTILICNAKTKEEIRTLLPTATLDRFRECVIEMTGKSKRYE